MQIESFTPDHSLSVQVRFTDANGTYEEFDIIGWAVLVGGRLRPVIIDGNGMPAVPDSAEDRAAGISWRLTEA